jgi:hypothetical protein
MRQFILKTPTHSTKQRMKEVQFWFIMRVLYLRHYKRIQVPHEYELYIDNIVESLSLLNNAKPTAVKYAISKINHHQFKPSTTELALASKYLDIPMRTIMEASKKGNRSIYRALEEYIKNGSLDLEPRFDTDILIEIEKFNLGFYKVFNFVSSIIKPTKIIYDLIEEDE